MYRLTGVTKRDRQPQGYGQQPYAQQRYEGGQGY